MDTQSSEIAVLKEKIAALESREFNGLEVIKEYFYTNANTISLSTKAARYCWPEFTVEVDETLDFKAMAEIISEHDNINFDVNLFKDGVIVAETGHYDKDRYEAGVLFYKGRITDQSSNFRLCIKSHDTNRQILPNRMQWGYMRYKAGDNWIFSPSN